MLPGICRNLFLICETRLPGGTVTVSVHEQDWLALLEGIELPKGGPNAVPLSDFDWESLQERFDVIFPIDYRKYFCCIGPGDWSGSFHIAVPKLGRSGGQYDLEQHNEWMHPKNPDIDLIGKENLALFQRAVHFASDVVGNSYFWDPVHIRQTGKHIVFAWMYSKESEVVADSFWEFVTEVCLGERGRSFIADFAPQQTFAAWG